MANTNKRSKRRKKPHSRRPAQTAESRQSEVITVAWMTTFLATLLAEVAAASVRGLTLVLPADIPTLMGHWLLTIALICGTVTLALTPLTLMMRRVPPPRPVTSVAVLSGLVPWFVLLIRSFATF